MEHPERWRRLAWLFAGDAVAVAVQFAAVPRFADIGRGGASSAGLATIREVHIFRRRLGCRGGSRLNGHGRCNYYSRQISVTVVVELTLVLVTWVTVAVLSSVACAVLLWASRAGCGRHSCGGMRSKGRQGDGIWETPPESPRTCTHEWIE